MDILNDFLSGVLKDVACGAVNQLQYSFCFNSFVKELEKEEDNLIETRRNVEDRVIHARRQTLKSAQVIDKWLENANIDSENVNRLLRETNAKKSCFFGYCPNWIWRYRLGKKLANKKADLQKIIQEGRQFIQLERIASIPSNTFDILTDKCMNFDSRKFAFEQIMEALKDDGVAMTGLYGMGGCGKTTLAMEVKKIAEAEHLFDTVIFVPVSSTIEVSRIQEKIASSLQYTFQENQEMERAQRLCMRLTQEKKILMILDDVWEKLDFGRIGIPSSEYHKGCKILITTRSEEVCILMDFQKKIYLPILTDEEAWTLFQNRALMSEDTLENIKHLAKSISEECKGLPVVIVAVVSSLKGKEEVIWRAALNKLRSSKPINIGKGLRDPYKCLQLSYDNLDNEKAKSLFLLCSVFPEDYEISVECLIRCAIGLGVAGEVDTYEEVRIEVTAAKMKLVSSCLMMEADHECVKMHDLVRDVAHWIAKNENKIVQCEPKKDVSLEQGSIRYLWCEKFPDGLDCSNLEFLTIQTKLEVSNGIFERMGKLRVLIITNKCDYGLQLSTTSFKALTNLRCLVLRYWKLRDISFVRDMKKLESLSFDRCSWPSFLDLQTDIAVTPLTNLKLLEFQSCDIKSKIFEEIKRIPFLEELYIFKHTWMYHEEEKVKLFFNSFSVPQTLQRYGIILGYDYFYTEYVWQEFCSYERTLVLNYFDISNEVIKGLAKKAKELSVANIKGGAKNIIPDIFQIEEGMNELKELRIRDCEEIVCLVDTSNHLSKMENLFSKLNLMRIVNMKHLKALWHGCQPANGCFEKLEKLYIENCPQFTSLFTYVIAQGLTELKILRICNCDILEYIVADDGKTKKSEDKFTIEHSVQSRIFQNLQQVEVHKCGKLKHVFSVSVTGGLTQLKMLEIINCNIEQIIEDVFPPTHHEETNEIVEEDDHQHFESNQFRFLARISSIPSTPSGSFFLSSLTLLKIYSCPMLGSLFTTYVTKTMTSLEKLKIFDCHGLKYIITPPRVKRNKKKNMAENEHEFESDLSMFSSLKKVSIKKCEKLEVIFPQCMLRSLPELNHLEVSGCEELRQIIEEDLEDKRLPNIVSPKPCFPKLASLLIQECHKLKCFTSVFVCNDLSNLKILIIKGPTELQEFISCEYDETGKTEVKLPQLKLIIFMHLSNFHQETIFLNVKHRIIRNCPILSLTSTTTPEELQQNFPLKGLEDTKISSLYIESLMDEIKELDKVSTSNNFTEFPSSQINEKSDKKFIEKDYGPKEVAPTTSINSKVDGVVGWKINDWIILHRPTNSTWTNSKYHQNDIRPASDGAKFSSHFFSKHDSGRERSRGGPATEGATIKTFPIGRDNISLVNGVTIHKSSGANILPQDSHVVKQDNEMNEDKTEIAPYKTIKIQEGVNLLDKTEGIGIVSHIDVVVTPAFADTRTRLEKYKHFADLNDS
ncbi:disease resistance protein SUMM2-like isoform X3 [Vigna angularis]|uniref:disease resistance protein SUMM2-like isoform X3 n=1 Tax=Phaseolus angularis TaxID=3914 RepID=UPI0022B4E886|nr:disease resistance protein SUMM2-like isoform X3 [Vigna angularis]